jgi:hypothetical protein
MKPVAWHGLGDHHCCHVFPPTRCESEGHQHKKLYATPPDANKAVPEPCGHKRGLLAATVNLDNELIQFCPDCNLVVERHSCDPAKPEPVAWECQACDFIEHFCEQEHFVRRAGVDPYSVCSGKLSPLYATPPAAKRTE